MANIVLVNGIRNKSKNSVMTPMAHKLREAGHTVYEYAYPFRRAWQLYFRKIRNKDALGLYRYCEQMKGDVVISHSNGSLVTQGAIKHGLEVDLWFSFGGACTSDKMAYPPRCFKMAFSIFNPYDMALKGGALLPGHKFGKLGSEGYRGHPSGNAADYDHRWVNVNGSSSTRWKLNHSHYFNGELDQWSEFVLNNIEEPGSQKQVLPIS